ncbi:MAG: cell division protein FtsQ/DivIB [Desulfovibrionaceae bacterium]
MLRDGRRRAPSNRRRGGGGSALALPRGVRRFLAALAGLAFLAGMAVVLYGGYRLLTTSPYFSLREIDVTGAERMSRAEVLSRAQVNEGMNALALNMTAVQSRLSAAPWVQSVTLRRSLPDTLTLAVTEKAPFFWVQQGETMYYADADGRAIAPVTGAGFVSRPVLMVEPGAEAARALLPRLARMLASGGLPFGLEHLAWVRCAASGDVEMYLDGPHLTLRLPVDGFDTHLARMKTVLADLKANGEDDRIAAITAGDDRVWVRLRS